MDTKATRRDPHTLSTIGGLGPDDQHNAETFEWLKEDLTKLYQNYALEEVRDPKAGVWGPIACALSDALQAMDGTRTVESIREQIAALEGAAATLAGEPLCVWDGQNRDWSDIPAGGALLHVDWAVSDQSYVNWYATTEQAKAALLALARQNGRTPSGDGFHVDLTAYNCHRSGARVERRG